MSDDAGKDVRCYICGRTSKEVENYWNNLVEDQMENLITEIKSDRTEMKKLDEIAASEKKDQANIDEAKKFLALFDDFKNGKKSNTYLDVWFSILTLDRATLDKYKGWNEKKFVSALDCDYPFTDNEKSVVPYIKNIGDSTLGAVYEQFTKNLHQFEVISNSSPKQSGLIDYVREKNKCRNNPIRFIGGFVGRIDDNKGVKIPICCICEETFKRPEQRY